MDTMLARSTKQQQQQPWLAVINGLDAGTGIKRLEAVDTVNHTVWPWHQP